MSRPRCLCRLLATGTWKQAHSRCLHEPLSLHRTFTSVSQPGQPCRGRRALSPSISDHSRAFPPESTIYALSTADGQAAIAVIRISGPAAVDIYHELCPAQPPLRPRHVAVRTLFEPAKQPGPDTILDPQAVVLLFPSPHSATGEDVLELHVHGGTAIVKSVMNAIASCSRAPGMIRYAEPGEFTKRAFFNDRMDLIQVEALGDSLNAITEQQRRLSVRGTASRLGQQYDEWRKLLLAARGELEALIDFSEDQHFDESPAELIRNVEHQIMHLRVAVDLHARSASRGELLRNGIGVSLLGAPNAGKSSLLNRIVGRDAVIVNSKAGTTRDVVEVSLDIGGYLCRFADTAGLRRALGDAESHATSSQEIDEVELEGMRRARQQAERSDLVVAVLSFEVGTEMDTTRPAQLHIDDEVAETVQGLLERRRDVLLVVNKQDLQSCDMSISEAEARIHLAIPASTSIPIHFASCAVVQTTRPRPNDCAPMDGIDSFMGALTRKFAKMTHVMSVTDSKEHDSTPGEARGVDKSIWQDSLGVTERQRVLLNECGAHLDRFLKLASPNTYIDEPTLPGCGYDSADAARDDASDDVDFVLAAEHLRAAAGCLARITGRGEAGDVEEVLGVVFERFCVGK